MRACPGTLTMMCVFCARVFLASLALFSSLITPQTNKTNRAFCSTKTRCVSSKSVTSLINYQIWSQFLLFSKEKPDFSRHTEFWRSSLLLRLLSFFLSFFLSFRASFPFREREGKRERTFLRFPARERKSARKNTEERDLFLMRKCPPRNKNGNKMKRLS